MKLTDDEFFDLCVRNHEYQIERDANGKAKIMSGTGSKTENRHAKLTRQLDVWAERNGCGRVGVSRPPITLAAAGSGSAEVLYTKDLNHGQRYGTVLVQNPFI